MGQDGEVYKVIKFVVNITSEVQAYKRRSQLGGELYIKNDNLTQDTPKS